MNTVTKVAAAGAIALAIGGGAVACSSQPQTVHVLQYGYYNPQHVWVTSPTPYYVYVTKSEYNANKTHYSTESYAKTYTKTHTVTTVNKGYSVSSDGKSTTKTTTTKTTKTTTSNNTKSSSGSKPNMNKSTGSSSSKKK